MTIVAKRISTFPMESDKPCALCGRYHRKLYNVDGYWLGRNCAENYKDYQRDKNPKSIIWHGYEREYNNVKAMITGIK